MDDELEGASLTRGSRSAPRTITRCASRSRRGRSGDEITTTERAAAAWTHRTRVEVLEREARRSPRGGGAAAGGSSETTTPRR